MNILFHKLFFQHKWEIIERTEITDLKTDAYIGRLIIRRCPECGFVKRNRYWN